MTGNNPNLDLVNTNAYTKFGKILIIGSQDIKRKQNYEQNSTKVKSMNSVKNVRKMMRNNPNIGLVIINAYTK